MEFINQSITNVVNRPQVIQPEVICCPHGGDDGSNLPATSENFTSHRLQQARPDLIFWRAGDLDDVVLSDSQPVCHSQTGIVSSL